MPARIQRSRKKGWRMPEGAVYVGRPTRWGNPFPVGGAFIMWATVARGRINSAESRRLTAVELFRAWLTKQAPPAAAIADTGDLIEYESGIAMSTGEAAQGIAAQMAWISREEIKIAPPPAIADLAAVLKGSDLVCWCPLDQPCHADVLLELANA